MSAAGIQRDALHYTFFLVLELLCWQKKKKEKKKITFLFFLKTRCGNRGDRNLLVSIILGPAPFVLLFFCFCFFVFFFFLFLHFFFFFVLFCFVFFFLARTGVLNRTFFVRFRAPMSLYLCFFFLKKKKKKKKKNVICHVGVVAKGDTRQMDFLFVFFFLFFFFFFEKSGQHKGPS